MSSVIRLPACSPGPRLRSATLVKGRGPTPASGAESVLNFAATGASPCSRPPTQVPRQIVGRRSSEGHQGQIPVAAARLSTGASATASRRRY